MTTPEAFASEPFFPLDVYFCEGCCLVQLIDVIDPEVLFRNYVYVTGTSDTIRAHNVEYAQTVADLLGLGSTDLVVEVASNDGSLLKCFRQHGVRTLGVEPAANIAAIARAEGIETVDRFFGSAVAEDVRASFGPARAVVANNVLAHVDETRDFLLGCRSLLDSGGLVVVEVPSLLEMVSRLEFDTIYHEHLCYFSATTLLRLCDEVGLTVVRIDHLPVHGGSLRLYAGRRDDFGSHSGEVLELVDHERRAGLCEFSTYLRFADEVEASRRSTLDLLGGLRAEGKRLAGYGAPAKGNTLLNYYGIGSDLLPYTVDKSPLKVGYYTPGTHIPVLPVSTLLERQPDYVVILAWNFAEEIMRQQEEYRNRGGQFIVPIPEPKVV